MMENEHKHDKPNYIAVIPSNVRYDKRLKASDLGYIQLVTISEENNVVVNKRRIFVKK